jgi:peptidoglycan/xylan/chitin deacetylase (PgdA/CDA1 family)
MVRSFAFLVLCIGLAACQATDSRADHGVVLLYHHVSEDTPAVTSVTPARFESHLDYLAENDFEVWPLYRLLATALDGAEPLPDNVVAITFDDAYESVYSEAWPRLRERGWPFAVFVNTDAVDAGHSPYMSWDQLRALYENGVTIGNHSASHAHLIARRDGESASAWRERVSADIEKADRRISEEIGAEPDLFAYPYGEISPDLATLVASGHDYALVQRSGAVGPATNRLAVPRFPMASGFDGLERFALAVDARPLPVTDSRPEPPGEGVRGLVQRLRLTVAEGGYRIAQLACYGAGGDRLEVSVEQGPPHAVTVAVGGRGSTGRNKINCTAPAADGSGDFFWHSFQWVQDAVRD